MTLKPLTRELLGEEEKNKDTQMKVSKQNDFPRIVKLEI